jgi:hypothetical protein
VRARLVSTRDASKVIELVGSALTIGRAPDCEVRIADDRISSRHCRLFAHDGSWGIEDLKSTNRTFLNGEPLSEQARRLHHGDLIRIGAPELGLFESRYVIVEQVAEPPDPRKAWQATEAALRRQVAELQAALVERNAEIVRVGAMYRTLQNQCTDHAAATVSAERANEVLATELEAVRDDLAVLRANHAGCRDAAEKAKRRASELEAQLAAQERKARSELNDANQRCKELESKVRMASSELAVARDALAVATANIKTLQQSYDDALVRLDNGILGSGPRERPR